MGAFKEEIAKKDRILAERDGLLSAEKKKPEFNAAKLKAAEIEIAQLKTQAAELNSALEAKDDEILADLKEVGYDAYREAVKSIKFLNPGVELNLRGLDPFHGVKDGQFWDFHDHQNPVLLDPTSMDPFNCDSPPPQEDGADVAPMIADGAEV